MVSWFGVDLWLVYLRVYFVVSWFGIDLWGVYLRVYSEVSWIDVDLWWVYLRVYFVVSWFGIDLYGGCVTYISGYILWFHGLVSTDLWCVYLRVHYLSYIFVDHIISGLITCFDRAQMDSSWECNPGVGKVFFTKAVKVRTDKSLDRSWWCL